MLKILKYLIFSIVFTTSTLGDILTWGGYTKVDITKDEVEQVIQNYVDTNYPLKIKKYNQQLAKIKQSKLQSVLDITFVHGDLMWQDTIENKSLSLNQLEAKRYCKTLDLANRKDWRVPTYKELLELVDYSKKDPAVIKKVKHIEPTSYWSDTQKHSKKKERVKTYWYVEFHFGESNFSSELEKRDIRCVRNLSLKKDDY